MTSICKRKLKSVKHNKARHSKMRFAWKCEGCVAELRSKRQLRCSLLRIPVIIRKTRI